jgi:hypothetical protein
MPLCKKRKPLGVSAERLVLKKLVGATGLGIRSRIIARRVGLSPAQQGAFIFDASR